MKKSKVFKVLRNVKNDLENDIVSLAPIVLAFVWLRQRDKRERGKKARPHCCREKNRFRGICICAAGV